MQFNKLTVATFSAFALVAVGPAVSAAATGAPFQIWGANKISGGLPSDVPLDTHCAGADAHDIDVAAGCFKEVGDHIYVKDTNPDGKSAMIYYTVDGDDAACVNSDGHGTTAVCDLSSWIPENKQVCIWAGRIDMDPNSSTRFKYYIESGSKVCFNNNN